jgi:hypothetical protein
MYQYCREQHRNMYSKVITCLNKLVRGQPNITIIFSIFKPLYSFPNLLARYDAVIAITNSQ